MNTELALPSIKYDDYLARLSKKSLGHLINLRALKEYNRQVLATKARIAEPLAQLKAGLVGLVWGPDDPDAQFYSEGICLWHEFGHGGTKEGVKSRDQLQAIIDQKREDEPDVWREAVWGGFWQ